MSTEPRIYFDACCFIDMAKSTLKLSVQADREPHIFYCRKFLEAARHKEASVFTSTLSVVECTHVKDLSKPNGQQQVMTEDVKRLFRGMLLSARSGATPVQPTPRILENARDLKWEEGATLRPMDAIHVATAIAMKCTHFLTTDALNGVAILNALGLAVCKANDIAHLVPDRYKQLVLPQGHAEIQASTASGIG